jgi:hypothetical protein
MRRHLSERTVLISIDDPVIRLDLETALSDAGYRVLPEDARVWPEDIALAAFGRDSCWRSMLPMFREMQRRRVPCLLLTLDASALPDELRGTAQIEKPFSSDQVVGEVGALVAAALARDGGIEDQGGGSTGRTWTGDAPAEGSASG